MGGTAKLLCRGCRGSDEKRETLAETTRTAMSPVMGPFRCCRCCCCCGTAQFFLWLLRSCTHLDGFVYSFSTGSALDFVCSFSAKGRIPTYFWLTRVYLRISSKRDTVI